MSEKEILSAKAGKVEQRRPKSSPSTENGEKRPRSDDPRITQAVKETVSQYREALKRLARE